MSLDSSKEYLKSIHFLLNWFKKNQRPLPWRKKYHPYQVWISEIMLQQTQVSTMLPYYSRWMKRFPQLEDLARAPSSEVLKAWEGLGYYRRAFHLHQAAKLVFFEQKGKFPKTQREWEKLPGVGPYTSGAVASIAFQESAAALDGNAQRVIARLLGWEKPLKKASTQKKLQAFCQQAYTQGSPREINQALMELGALICSKRKPTCPTCPLQTSCQAKAKELVEKIPISEPKAKPRRVKGHLFIVRYKEKFLVYKRPAKGLWGGLWEFPWLESKALPREEVFKKLPFFFEPAPFFQPKGDLKHVLTHRLFEMECWGVEIAKLPSPAPSYYWYTKEEIAQVPISGLAKKALLWVS